MESQLKSCIQESRCYMKLLILFRYIILIVFFICLNCTPKPIEENDKLTVINLKTEYKSDPLVIDIAKPRLSWELIAAERNTVQTAYEIRCASSKDDLIEGRNLLWNVKEESDQSVHIVYDGPELKSRQKVYWQVRIWSNHGQKSDWSEVACWEMGLLDKKDWQANWIEADIVEDTTRSQPAIYLRKEFNIRKPVASARLYITCHGLYESMINGTRIGDQVFTPGWTSYNKRLQYQVYDVLANLIVGDNAIGIVLGDGWYRGYYGWKDRRNVYGNKLAVLAQLEIMYQDGSRNLIVTDESWMATNDGPIIISDIYMGETYDARKEMPDWTKHGYDASNWKKVFVKDLPRDHLVASYGPPVRKIEEIKPIRITPGDDSTCIIDMGQNMVGWVRLKISGEKGTTITLRHAEVLDKYGKLYTENLRSAKQTVVYTCKGDSMEVFEPHFTFQGFRFVEMSGYPGTPDLDSVVGIVIHSDMTPTGDFACSDSLINQLHQNIRWGLKGNFLDVPTDCPQRDERMGWTGDAQVFAPTACFLMDAASFYTKWMKDLALDQGKDGKVCDVIPDVLDGGGGHTGWADAAILVPWTIYLNYGDRRILNDQYQSMKSWVYYMKGRAGKNNLWQGDWHYGDWLAFASDHPAYMGAYTETDLIATAYHAYSTVLLSKIARILGYDDEAREFYDLAEKVKSAFLNEFVTPNGKLVSHTQTAYTLALSMGLLPDSICDKAAENLYLNVTRFKHITTGFLGTPRICKTLTDYGYLEAAYMLLNRKEYPSWLYPVSMGATTIWERWDGIKPDSTFQNPGMNSLNHYAYGAIGKWLYSTVAGIEIDEDQPGYKHIIINPRPGGGLTHAKAELKTMYGLASSAWKLEKDQIKFYVIIPTNATATVYLPVKDLNKVLLDGKRLSENSDIKLEQDNEGKPIVQIGSGDYEFTCLQK